MFINIKNSSKVKKDMVICAACMVELNEKDGNRLYVYLIAREKEIKISKKNVKENPLGWREKSSEIIFVDRKIGYKLL